MPLFLQEPLLVPAVPPGAELLRVGLRIEHPSADVGRVLVCLEVQPVRADGLRSIEPVPREIKLAQQRTGLRSLAVALFDVWGMLGVLLQEPNSSGGAASGQSKPGRRMPGVLLRRCYSPRSAAISRSPCTSRRHRRSSGARSARLVVAHS
jgi:hypothetical protein